MKSGADAPMKCRLGFPKEDQTLIFRKAGLATFRLVQSRCTLYCLPLPIGFRWHGLYHDLGLQGAGKNE
jgi:hypothetical protein